MTILLFTMLQIVNSFSIYVYFSLLIFKYMMVGLNVLPNLLKAICKSNNILLLTMLQIVSLFSTYFSFLIAPHFPCVQCYRTLIHWLILNFLVSPQWILNLCLFCINIMFFLHGYWWMKWQNVYQGVLSNINLEPKQCCRWQA